MPKAELYKITKSHRGVFAKAVRVSCVLLAKLSLRP
jgi:hypothetical protein